MIYLVGVILAHILIISEEDFYRKITKNVPFINVIFFSMLSWITVFYLLFYKNN